MRIQLTNPFELQAYFSTRDLGQTVLSWPSLLSIFASVYSTLSVTLSPALWVEEGVPTPGAFPSKTQLWVLPHHPFSNTNILRLWAALKTEISGKPTYLTCLRPFRFMAFQQGPGPNWFQSWEELKSPAVTQCPHQPGLRRTCHSADLPGAGVDLSPESTIWAKRERWGECFGLGN